MVYFNSFSLHNHGIKDYYVPSFEAGGFAETAGGKINMPLSVTVHHAVTDGYHLKVFFDELQRMMDCPGGVAVAVFGYEDICSKNSESKISYGRFLLYDSINKYTLLYLWCEIVYNKAKRTLNGRIIYSDMHTQISLLEDSKKLIKIL